VLRGVTETRILPAPDDFSSQIAYAQVMESVESTPDVSIFTATSCQIHATAWVVQVVVGDTMPGKTGEVREIPRISIGLPWALAKVVHHMLGIAIETFEKQEGPISVPTTVSTQITAMLEKFNKKA
jgi:hypothetical protein